MSKSGRPKKLISLQVDRDAKHWKYASLHEALRDTLSLLATAIATMSDPFPAATQANKLDTTVPDEAGHMEPPS